MTMTMKNTGLVLPKNYVSINETEMEYIDGGKVTTNYWSARYASNVFGAMMATYYGNTGLATGTGIAAGIATMGIATVICGIAGGFSAVQGALFLGAYDDVQDIIDQYGSNRQVQVKVTTFFGVPTKISVKRW